MVHRTQNILITSCCLLFVVAGWSKYVEAYELLVGKTVVRREPVGERLSSSPCRSPQIRKDGQVSAANL